MIIKPEITPPIKAKIPSKQADCINPVLDYLSNEAKQYFLKGDPGTNRDALNEFIVGLKMDGVWSELDACWMLAVPTKSLAYANMKNPGTYTITETGTVTFTANRGVAGNGSTGALNTNFNPSTNAVKFTQTSASVGVYSRTNKLNVQEVDMSSSNSGANGTGIFLNASNPSGFFSTSINTNIVIQGHTLANTRGLLSIRRTNSAEHTKVQNGVDLITSLDANVSPVNAILYLLAFNVSGALSRFSTRELSFAFIGSGNIDHKKLYNRLQTYLTAIGAAV